MGRAAFWGIILVWLAACVPQPVYRSGQVERAPEKPPPRPQNLPPRKPPVVIKPEKTAHPLDPAKISTANAYQIGMASYYGKKFHGRKTANGEVFNMYKLTAAHRVLPLGTRIKVTRMDNGHWVEVKVNDRGPFIEGRVLDLSFAAALELEMVQAGTAKIMIEIVKPVE
jgi:rare lipoprotein A